MRATSGKDADGDIAEAFGATHQGGGARAGWKRSSYACAGPPPACRVDAIARLVHPLLLGPEFRVSAANPSLVTGGDWTMMPGIRVITALNGKPPMTPLFCVTRPGTERPFHHADDHCTTACTPISPGLIR